MSQYCYSSLSLGPESIRLLRLMPHENEKADIECELFEYSLKDSGKRNHLYEALSYAWGGSDKPRFISIKEHKLPVTVNLHIALSRLRDRSLPRIIWVDAVSIDQENLKERGDQVQLMAKIYSKANRVIVWLGEMADNSDDALEGIRVAAQQESMNSLNDKMLQQAILALLQRPWFRRIWVLQEIAAARHVLIKCGSIVIDGYVFCLGVKCFYEAYRELESSIRSITYLIRGAIFRPKYAISSSGTASLNIRPLGELIDMYHAHEATHLHDKVYSLLGMSSDELGGAGLSPDYEVGWGKLFEQLVKFLLCKQVFVKTWDDKKSAIIKSKGCILGQVSSTKSDITWDDGHKVDINSKACKREWQDLGPLQASAKSIREGDLVCLLRGAPKPMIIRLCKDYFAVIMIAVSLDDPTRNSIEWSEFLQSKTIFPRDFLLVWDWENSPEKLQDSGEYETLIRINNWVSEHSKTKLEGHLDKAIRTWNVALILGDLEEYKEAEERFREAIKGYEIAFGEEYSHTLKSQYGLTPLSWAAGNGYDAVVSLLLTKAEVDPDLRDSQDGRTPLSWAAEGGHEAVIKLLLGTGTVEVDSKDKHCRTPLSWAAEGGHEVVIKLLLAKGTVEIDSKDKYGQTPLSWAAAKGYEAVVKLLLEMGKVEIDSKDNHGQTPLSLAAERGHEAVIKLLFGTGTVEVDSKNKDGRTPLSWAAMKGHEAVVKLLLETGKVEIDAKDNHGQTPLSWAAERGHEAVVRLLLETGAVEVDSKNKDGGTPLLWAAMGGYEAVVKLLLETGTVEIDLKDNYGRTPLSWAAMEGHEAVIKLLFETGTVEVDSKDNYGRTPLLWAAMKGHEAVIKLLLETSTVEVDFKDENCRTPLLWAAMKGHEAVVKLLIKTGTVEVNSKDKYGKTPLSWAAKKGHEAVVKLLLETGTVEIDSKDKYGRTPLLWAAMKGHEAVIELLLETSTIEVDSKDKQGETPLSWAAKRGHEAVVNLLQSHAK